MKKLLTSVICVTGFFLQTALAAPLQNGISVHSELGKEQFIAALYSTTLSENASDILIADEEKQIQVRILTDRLTARRFKRMWIEGMAINASSTELENQAANMAAFSNMLKVNLVRGDIFAVDRTMDDVKVIVNGATLGTIDDPGFFDLLLRSWIGPVPLSSRFRETLLVGGNIDENLRTQFNATRPSDDRISAVASAIAQRDGSQASASSRPSNSTPSSSRAPASAQTPVSRPEIVAPRIVAPEISAPTGLRPPPSSDEEDTTSAQTPAQASAPAPEPEPEPQATPTPEAQQEPVQVAVAEVEEPEPSPAESILDDEDTEEVTAESLLARQVYIRKLRAWIYKELKYPGTSLQRNEQGVVRISISINRDGSMRGYQIIDESEYSRLNKATTKAADKASPYPPVPEQVQGEEFTFTLPIVWQIIEG
jgi:protein TonB